MCFVGGGLSIYNLRELLGPYPVAKTACELSPLNMQDL